MATATMATAAGAAALLYYTLNRKLKSSTSHDDDDNENENDSGEAPSRVHLGIERVSHRLIQAPATWLETISTLSETLRFTYSETLGKWPIGDLAFGINFLLKRQGALHVGSVFGGEDSVQLKGLEIAAELRYLLNLLTLCWHFSKKPFPLFLEETGYTEESVLLQEPKAGILKPAFTILVDHKTKCFFLLIRGTHSIKDTLTAVTGAVVPFHHTVVHEGGVSNLVLGYAHCGMVAAARWISKLATPCLKQVLGQFPDYKLKIVGHSLGGGTAALLTYVLREQKELSSTTCVAFAPAACMTWELAESGNDFITSVINGADLVPTFSAASVDDLRAEVTASAWLNDLKNQIEHTRILSTVYRSASALGSRLPSIASAKAKVAGAGGNFAPCLQWYTGCDEESTEHGPGGMDHTPFPSIVFMVVHWTPPPSHSCNNTTTASIGTIELPASSVEAKWTSEIEYSCTDEMASHAHMGADLDDGEDLISDSHDDRMNEVDFWQHLEHELYERSDSEGADVVKEIREEEEAAIAEDQPGSTASGTKEVRRFFPPGKIMHIVTLHLDSAESEGDTPTSSGSDNSPPPVETKVGIFHTPRTLYGKLRLSQTMVSDHFMPVYRRQIEKLIKELEKEEAAGNRKDSLEVLL
ncbi:LIPASE CLASS 3 FAMILY PROTEIN [Salix viminalis]|uniref:LIPASE CLASS 3 FAMILY PROTEIN n=1 Tax=Salix viminalis TaxID=40686 RepID=A0A9Q0T841_SALVM|nr:LIPASE CLASS 3 FAMILY PROTEIN [Salix viminalis]